MLPLPPLTPDLLLAPDGACYARVLGYFRERSIVEPADQMDPGVPIPAAAQLAQWLRDDPAGGEQKIITFFLERRKMLDLAASDPLRFGLEISWWKRAEALLERPDVSCLFILGGNGSAKTKWMARDGVRHLQQRPKSPVVWCTYSEEVSRLTLQPYVYELLPSELRANSAKRGSSIAWNVGKKQFANNMLVMPHNESYGVFKFYKQDLHSVEGPGWFRVYCDEDMPLAWFNSLPYRLPRKGGKLIWSFTAVDGITPAVREATKGAVTLEYRRAPLLNPDRVYVEDCPKGCMPFLRKCTLPGAYVLYPHMSDNPYSGYAVMAEQKKNADDVEKQARFYGYREDTRGAALRRFGSVNVIPARAVPAQVSRYRIVDPHPNKPYFILWIAVDPRGYHYVYREFPDWTTYGDWAVASGRAGYFNGDPGPAQRPLGFSVAEYKEVILKAEGNHLREEGWHMDGEPIEDSLMDPRSGQQSSVAETSGGVSTMDRFRMTQTESGGRVIGPSMDFRAAPGFAILTGLQAINDLLAWKPQEGLTANLNEPKLYVVEDCRNTIWACQNFAETPKADDDACEEPIDDLRYAATEELAYVDPRRERSRRYA